jgi:hypothetical protein
MGGRVSRSVSPGVAIRVDRVGLHAGVVCRGLPSQDDAASRRGWLRCTYLQVLRDCWWHVVECVGWARARARARVRYGRSRMLFLSRGAPDLVHHVRYRCRAYTVNVMHKLQYSDYQP